MNKKVAYIYDSSIEGYTFGSDHPMKPKKIVMAHDIINKSGLLSMMDLYVR
jgi:histone deacetylase 1/2